MWIDQKIHFLTYTNEVKTAKLYANSFACVGFVYIPSDRTYLFHVFYSHIVESHKHQNTTTTTSTQTKDHNFHFIVNVLHMLVIVLSMNITWYYYWTCTRDNTKYIFIMMAILVQIEITSWNEYVYKLNSIFLLLLLVIYTFGKIDSKDS